MKKARMSSVTPARQCGCPFCMNCAPPSRRRFLSIYRLVVTRGLVRSHKEIFGDDSPLARPTRGLRQRVDSEPIWKRVVMRSLIVIVILQSAALGALPLGLILRLLMAIDLRVGSSAPISCEGFVTLVNLVPSPKTRKLLMKLVADQADHIRQLQEFSSHRSARWNWWLTWAMILYVGLTHFVMNIARAFRGRSAA